jgi:hypothetical protein
MWGEFQNGVAMGPRHGENEMGIRGNPQGQLARDESGRVTTEDVSSANEQNVGWAERPRRQSALVSP